MLPELQTAEGKFNGATSEHVLYVSPRFDFSNSQMVQHNLFIPNSLQAMPKCIQQLVQITHLWF
jgi:hypothetical protein